MKNVHKKLPVIIYLLLYFLVNALFLTRYPFVHSDEAWISGLTRNILESGSIFSTEAFFTIYPRHPHMIKILFQLLQVPFVLLFGYHISSVRLISLLFSILVLIPFYRIILRFLGREGSSLLFTVLFSLNIQYIYASHFARQEIVLLAILLWAFDYYLSLAQPKLKHSLLLGSLLGIAIGIHPNSFILALIFGALYLYDIICKTKRFRDLFALAGTVSFCGVIFVLLSLLGDSRFFQHYSSYGSTLGVNQSLGDKLLSLDDFYLKLYDRISATYYTPDIRIYFISFAVLFLFSILIVLRKALPHSTGESSNEIKKCLISILAIQAGIVIIGRYNPTSIIMVFPFFYMLLALLFLPCLRRRTLPAAALLSIMILLSAFSSGKEISPYLSYDYNDYLKQIEHFIPEDSVVLGNLNAEYYFDNGKFYDYRNLAHLEENGLTFEDFIRRNSIEYILYYEELDYIHRNPQWNILYGEDNYYEEMNLFLASSCTLTGEFENPLYAIRITRYMLDYPWKVRVYKVKTDRLSTALPDPEVDAAKEYILHEKSDDYHR